MRLGDELSDGITKKRATPSTWSSSLPVYNGTLLSAENQKQMILKPVCFCRKTNV